MKGKRNKRTLTNVYAGVYYAAFYHATIILKSCPRHPLVKVRLVSISRGPRSLSPKDDTARIDILVQHATNRYSRYEQLGGIDDLNKAVVFDQEALSHSVVSPRSTCHPNFMDGQPSSRS